MPGSPSGASPWPGHRPRSSPPQHCPHCWGNCGGRCLIPGIDGCIHLWPKPPREPWLRLIRTRRFWHHILFGVH